MSGFSWKLAGRANFNKKNWQDRKEFENWKKKKNSARHSDHQEYPVGYVETLNQMPMIYEVNTDKQYSAHHR